MHNETAKQSIANPNAMISIIQKSVILSKSNYDISAGKSMNFTTTRHVPGNNSIHPPCPQINVRLTLPHQLSQARQRSPVKNQALLARSRVRQFFLMKSEDGFLASRKKPHLQNGWLGVIRRLPAHA